MLFFKGIVEEYFIKTDKVFLRHLFFDNFLQFPKCLKDIHSNALDD